MNDQNEITTETQTAMPSWMQPETLPQALDLAKSIASSGLVPDHLADNPGGILLIIDQAQRWGMSPLAVAQGTSVVHGKLCYEGKLVHAALLAMGAIKGALDYEYSGDEGKPSRAVRVTGTLPNGETRSITGDVAGWKTEGKGSPWTPKQYDKMLAYRGAREWARMYAPGAMLGVTTPDEAVEIKDADVLPEPKPATVRTPAEPTAGQTPEAPVNTVAPPQDAVSSEAEKRSRLLVEAKRIARRIHGEPGGADVLAEVKNKAGVPASATYDDHAASGGDLDLLLAELERVEEDMGVA